MDSVNDETNKLLRGVRDGPGGGDSDNDEDQDGGDGGPGSQRTQRKGAHRAEATLAKSAAQLRSKKLDLEFSVDPLFKKTCADFDEGGAHGLLMNHLSLGVGIDGEGLRVVFDASDAVAKSGDEEEADEVEPVDTVDLSELRGGSGVAVHIRRLTITPFSSIPARPRRTGLQVNRHIIERLFVLG